MAVDKSRFVLLCQQGLACGLVVAIAAPAAGLVTLDIVAPPSGGSGADRYAAASTPPGCAPSGTGPPPQSPGAATARGPPG